MLAAGFFPFDFVATYPHRRVIYLTATDDLAKVAGEFQHNLITEYGEEYGICISPKSRSKLDFSIDDLNGKPTGGSFHFAGVGSGVHGRGASLLILDDLFGSIKLAISAEHQELVMRTYSGSIARRMAPNGAIVSIGTPFHVHDWFGRIKAAEEAGGDKWEWVKLHAFARLNDPLGRAEGEALWPDEDCEEAWPAHKLEEVKRAMIAEGAHRDWMSQYMLEPIYGDGVSEWPEHYFARLLEPYKPFGDSRIRVMALDPSRQRQAVLRADYQAFAFADCDSRGHATLQCELWRLDQRGIVDKAIELVKRWRPKFLIVETNGGGYSLYEQLFNASEIAFNNCKVIGRHHQEEKTARIQARVGALLASGFLHFHDSPGNRMVVEQLRVFPRGDHDDGPDAVEMVCEGVTELQRPRTSVPYQMKPHQLPA